MLAGIFYALFSEVFFQLPEGLYRIPFHLKSGKAWDGKEELR